MGRLDVVIPDDLDTKFRVEVARQGGKKGDLKKAVIEAIELWLETKAKT